MDASYSFELPDPDPKDPGFDFTFKKGQQELVFIIFCFHIFSHEKNGGGNCTS
jgi:hypothetical protein